MLDWKSVSILSPKSGDYTIFFKFIFNVGKNVHVLGHEKVFNQY